MSAGFTLLVLVSEQAEVMEYEVTGLYFWNNSHPVHLDLKRWQIQMSESRGQAMLVLS